MLWKQLQQGTSSKFSKLGSLSKPKEPAYEDILQISDFTRNLRHSKENLTIKVLIPIILKSA
jgi:hypothetical protein